MVRVSAKPDRLHLGTRVGPHSGPSEEETLQASSASGAKTSLGPELRSSRMISGIPPLQSHGVGSDIPDMGLNRDLMDEEALLGFPEMDLGDPYIGGEDL
jgi:hypothetical protein